MYLFFFSNEVFNNNFSGPVNMLLHCKYCNVIDIYNVSLLTVFNIILYICKMFTANKPGMLAIKTLCRVHDEKAQKTVSKNQQKRGRNINKHFFFNLPT